MMKTRGSKRQVVGTVVSDKMDKTVVVMVVVEEHRENVPIVGKDQRAFRRVFLQESHGRSDRGVVELRVCHSSGLGQREAAYTDRKYYDREV